MVKTDRGLFIFGRKSFLKCADSTRVDFLRKLEFPWAQEVRDFELAGLTAIFLTEL